MIEKSARLRDLSKAALHHRLKRDGLIFDLGPFRARVRGRYRALERHLQECYGAVRVIDDATIVHQDLVLEAPTLLRRYIRPQVLARSTPLMPMVPLPPALVPLAFEMALNFSIATSHLRHLILHSGAVEIAGGAVMMSAASGSGKSTLTANLVAQGHRLLSDEFGLLDIHTGAAIGYPRPISLKNESVDLESSLLGDQRPVSVLTETPKGLVGYLPADDKAVDEAMAQTPVKAFVFPSFKPTTPSQVTQLPASVALMRLQASSPNYQTIGVKAYQVLAKLAATVPAYDISYRNSLQSVEIVEDIVKKQDAAA